MKKSQIKIIVLILSIVTVFTFFGCTKPEDNKEPEDTRPIKSLEEQIIRLVSPEIGATVQVVSDEIEEFSKNYTSYSSLNYYQKTVDHYYGGQEVKLSWEYKDEEPLYCEVYYSTNSDMSDAKIIATPTNSVNISYLYVATTYYWQVKAVYEDYAVLSTVYSFTTEDVARIVYVDGVQNVRDIGGYMTESGKRLKQGIIYRGSYLNYITSEGKEQMIKYLGIKSELDLRTPGEGGAGKKSTIGDDVYYENHNAPYYYNFQEKSYIEELIPELLFFTDESHFPVYFHCSVGRDRTGCLAILLEGLCGVSEKDICYDYELSTFSEIGTRDVSIEGSGPNRDWFINYIKGFGEETDSFMVCTEKYMLQLGITSEQIAKIRSNLIEG